MKCTNCNAEIADDALFCSECGMKISSPVPEQVPASEDISATLSDTPAEEVSDAVSDTASDMISDADADSLDVPEDAPSPFAPAADAFAGEASEAASTVPAFGMQENTPPAPPAFPAPEFQPQAPQPEFTPVPQPMAPVAAPVDNSGVPGEKKSKKFFVPMIIFIILFALAAAGLGVGAYLYMKQKSDLNTKIEDRDKTIEEKEDEISDLEEQVTEYADKEEVLKNDKVNLEQNITQLQENVNSLTNDLEAAKKERDDYKGQVDASANELKDLYGALQKMVPPTTTYFASKNVIVLKPGATDTIMVSLRTTGTFTVTFNSDNKDASAKWTNQWTDDGSLHSCPLTFTAGSKPGRTVFTFTNNKTSDTFQIIVIIAQ